MTYPQAINTADATPATGAYSAGAILADRWDETPEAVALLSGLTANQLYLARPLRVMGTDRLEIVPPEELGAIRTAHVEALAGGKFDEFHRQGRHGEYIAIDAEQPSVHDVLVERFGSPGSYEGFSVADAQACWRRAAALVAPMGWAL